MFKIDVEAIRQAAEQRRLMANPANAANDSHPDGERLARLAKLAVSHTCERGADEAAWCWTEQEIKRFEQRRDALAHLGEVQAERIAERLHIRDRDLDDRAMCVECSHMHLSRCGVAAAAEIGAELGEIATMLQRCPAFERRAAQ